MIVSSDVFEAKASEGPLNSRRSLTRVVLHHTSKIIGNSQIIRGLLGHLDEIVL